MVGAVLVLATAPATHGATLALESACAPPDGSLVVELSMSDLGADEAAAFEGFFEFDNSLLTLQTIVFEPEPFGLIVTPGNINQANGNGRLDLAAAIDPATQSPTSQDAVLVTLTFTPDGPESCGTAPGELLAFRANTPPSQLLDSADQPILTTLLDPVITIDGTPPTLTVPPDVTIGCEDDDQPPATGLATASDTCDPSPVLSFTDDVAVGACAGESVLTRTWTATDGCGGAASADQVITVQDTTAPLITGVPPDATVECDAIPEPPPVLAATDTCDPSVIEALFDGQTSEPGACAGESTITRAWTATDGCGNVTTATQVLSVVDTIGPVVIDIPADVTVQCDAVPSPPDTLTASDACDGDVAQATFDGETSAPGECPILVTLTRTW
jgi:hypothetical protein